MAPVASASQLDHSLRRPNHSTSVLSWLKTTCENRYAPFLLFTQLGQQKHTTQNNIVVSRILFFWHWRFIQICIVKVWSQKQFWQIRFGNGVIFWNGKKSKSEGKDKDQSNDDQNGRPCLQEGGEVDETPPKEHHKTQVHHVPVGSTLILHQIQRHCNVAVTVVTKFC